jgi:hypothetical protein
VFSLDTGTRMGDIFEIHYFSAQALMMNLEAYESGAK